MFSLDYCTLAQIKFLKKEIANSRFEKLKNNFMDDDLWQIVLMNCLIDYIMMSLTASFCYNFTSYQKYAFFDIQNESVLTIIII